MDPLAGVLDGPRARSAFQLKVVLESPWSMRVEDESPLAVVAVTHGSAWLVPCVPDDEIGEPTPLTAGDVAIVRGTGHYLVADGPTTDPTIVIDERGECHALDGQSLVDSMDLGVRTWGHRLDGRDVMLVGTYQTAGEVSRWLLDALPRAIVLRRHEWDGRVVELLAEEIVKEEPGQQVVLDRLLDLLLVSVLRTAFAADRATVPSWFGANADPVIGRVIRLMQNEPSAPWTVASLASSVGVSRALLARRFHDVVGEPPMSFLTAWRMALAADLIAQPSATVTQVAAAVGYGSPFTFSTAFKRCYGTSPRTYRERALAEPQVSEPIGHALGR